MQGSFLKNYDMIICISKDHMNTNGVLDCFNNFIPFISKYRGIEIGRETIF